MLKKLKNIIKSMLAISWVRGLYNWINRTVLEIFSSNRVFATIYSLPGFITFNREQYGVLRGRRNYYRNLKRTRFTHVELRRNIHRLEKGMIMKPMRKFFARDYIGETIDFYEQAINQFCEDKDSLDASEMQWAKDVLDRYFSCVDYGNKSIESARKRYDSISDKYNCTSMDKKAPYLSKDRQNSKVSYDDLLKLAMQRRSVRWFKNKKVPRKLIDKALIVGRQSPSACNRLPYKFRIFDDPVLVKKIAGLPFGASGYSNQVPSVVVVTGNLDNYFSPRDRHVIYIDASLAAMSFMFALETLGLSSSVINWPDFEPLEMKMQKVIGLDISERVIMLIAVGYPDPEGGIPYSQKKDLDAIRNYNETSKK